MFQLVEDNPYLTGVRKGSSQRACEVLVVAMATTVWVICWMNALATYALGLQFKSFHQTGVS
jgi:hypothetical protein